MNNIRDMRNVGWYFIENEVVTEKLSKIGPYGLMVYNYIVCHSRKEVFEGISQEGMATALGISRATVIRATEVLVKEKMLETTGQRGQGQSNLYVLLSVKQLPEEDEAEFIATGAGIPGYVYCLQDTAKKGRHLIGHCRNFIRTLWSLKKLHPTRLAVVILRPSEDPEGVCRSLYKMFEKKRKEGEWFELSKEESNRVRSFLAETSVVSPEQQQAIFTSSEQQPAAAPQQQAIRKEVLYKQDHNKSPQEMSFTDLVEYIDGKYFDVNGKKCDWSNKRSFKELQKLRENTKTWSAEEYPKAVDNYFGSENINPADPPELFISKLKRYRMGRLNTFGHPMVDGGNGNGHKKSAGDARVESLGKNWSSALQRRAGFSDVTSGGPEEVIDEAPEARGPVVDKDPD